MIIFLAFIQQKAVQKLVLKTQYVDFLSISPKSVENVTHFKLYILW